MSRFYGSVDGGRSEATRCGHATHGLTVRARSYSGDVRVQMYADGDVDCVSIRVEQHDGSMGRLIYRGPVADLLRTEARVTMLKALATEQLVNG